ncbi:MAG: hypothetical protein FJY17_05120 [Bacteroidetes bacterium]|nr:hypothetical protein [Bacteroidota bacterium]
MKKVLLSAVAIAALTLSSCGKSACDCKKEKEEAETKMASELDSAKKSDLQKELDALKEDCKDYKEEDSKDCK